MTSRFSFSQAQLLQRVKFPEEGLNSIRVAASATIHIAGLVVRDNGHFGSVRFISHPRVSSGRGRYLVLGFEFIGDRSKAPLVTSNVHSLLLVSSSFIVRDLRWLWVCGVDTSRQKVDSGNETVTLRTVNDKVSTHVLRFFPACKGSSGLCRLKCDYRSAALCSVR